MTGWSFTGVFSVVAIAASLLASCDNPQKQDHRKHHGKPVPPASLWREGLEEDLALLSGYADTNNSPRAERALGRLRKYACSEGVCGDPTPSEGTADDLQRLLQDLLFSYTPEVLADVAVDVACTLCERENKPCTCDGGPCMVNDLAPRTGRVTLDFEWTMDCGGVVFRDTGDRVLWGKALRAYRGESPPTHVESR